MHLLLKAALLLFLFSVSGCEETNTDTEQRQSANTVSGTLNLSLKQRVAIGVYVGFTLTEYAADGMTKLIAQSDFIQVYESPFPFSLAYPPGTIKQQNRYILITTVAEDPEGTDEIVTMSSPVLTQGQLSVIHIAISQTPEPVE